jgi:hypothetical protein
MQLVALDISSVHTGIAYGPTGEAPRFAVKDLIGGDAGDCGGVFRQYADWLQDIVAVHSPDVIAFEAPIVGGHKGRNAAYLLIGLAAITELVCAWRGVECRQVDSGEARKEIIGNGHAKKPDILFKLRQMGFQVFDHNAGDALVVFLFARDWLAREGRAA